MHIFGCTPSAWAFLKSHFTKEGYLDMMKRVEITTMEHDRTKYQSEKGCVFFI